MRYTNDTTIAVRRALERMMEFEKIEQEPFEVLTDKLREINQKGKKEEFMWRSLAFTFYPLDANRRVDLRWVVSNPLTGNQAMFRPRDYQGKRGGIMYRRMASAMIKSV